MHTTMQIYSPVFRYTKSHEIYNDLFIEAIMCTFAQEHHKRHTLSEFETHYIAIMAATRHRCTYIMEKHLEKFLHTGGDRTWLQGLQFAPLKYKLLDELNRALAHQPWHIGVMFIKELVNEGGNITIEKWSIAELTEAALILAQTHVMCSLVHALGGIEIAREETDDEDDSDYEEEQQETKVVDELNKENATDKCENVVEELLRRMKNLDAASNQAESDNFNNALVDGTGNIGGNSPVRDPEEQTPVFSFNMHFGYVDFYSKSDKSVRTFRIVEYNWSDHGFNVINDWCSDKLLVTNLDRKFSHTQSMTYKFMGKFEKVDTKKYRMAVWNYIQALFGVRHDDYDYRQVNVLLDKETKTFIKMMACSPHKLDSDSLASVMTGFKQSEKTHVLILVAEARLQAQLLYFSRAVYNYNLNRAHQRPPLD